MQPYWPPKSPLPYATSASFPRHPSSPYPARPCPVLGRWGSPAWVYTGAAYSSLTFCTHVPTPRSVQIISRTAHSCEEGAAGAEPRFPPPRHAGRFPRPWGLCARGEARERGAPWSCRSQAG